MDTAWIPPNMFFKKVFPYFLSNMDIFLGVAMLNFHDSGFRGPWLVHWSNLGDRWSLNLAIFCREEFLAGMKSIRDVHGR